MSDPAADRSDLPARKVDRPRRRRWLKRFLWLGALGVLVIVVLLVALPSILSSGVGKAAIASRLSERLKAPVDLGSLSLSWRGEQKIEDLRVGTPERRSGTDDLLHVRSIRVSQGLLSFVRGERTATIDVVEPIIRVMRDKEGRFSYSGLGGASEDAARRRERQKTGKPAGSGRLPEIRVRMKLALRGGEIHYRDELLGTDSRLTGCDLDVDLEPEKIRLALRALVGEATGGESGSLEVNAGIDGLKEAGRTEDLKVTAKGVVRGLDLRPYAALIEDLGNVKPPEKAIDARFTVETSPGLLSMHLDVDAGYVALQGAALELPIREGGPEASLNVPCSMDLEPLVAALGRRSGVPEGGRLAGRVLGQLNLGGPVSVAALLGPSPSLADLRLDLDVGIRDFALELPPRSSAGSGAEKRPDATGKPFALSEKEVKVRLVAKTVQSVDEILIETGRLLAAGVEVDLTGTLENRPTRSTAGAVDAAKDAEKILHVDLGLQAELLLPRLVERLARHLPEGIEVGNETVATITETRLRGPLSARRPVVETLDVAGSLELAGGVRARGVEVDKLKAKFQLAGGTVNVTDLHATVNDGEVRSRLLSLGLTDEQAPFRAQLDLGDIGLNYRMAPLLSYVLPFVGGDASSLKGKLKGTLSLEGKGFDSTALKKNLRGSGSLRLADGQLASSPFFQQLGGLLKTSLDVGLFKEMGTDFNVDVGKIGSDNIFFQSQKGKIRKLRLSGATSFDKTIDYRVSVSALREAIGDKKIRAILSVAEKTLGDGGLPLKLTGSLSRPELTLDTESLPGLDRLLEAGASELLEGKLDRLLDGLQKKSTGAPEKKPDEKSGLLKGVLDSFTKDEQE